MNALCLYGDEGVKRKHKLKMKDIPYLFWLISADDFPRQHYTSSSHSMAITNLNPPKRTDIKTVKQQTQEHF
jgi:hypothetical protein